MQQEVLTRFQQEVEARVARGLCLETYPNAVREISIINHNDWDAAQLNELEKALNSADGIVLRSLGGNGLLNEVKSGFENERGATLKALTEKSNTLAIADGITTGFGAALVSACQWRIVSPRTTYALTQVRQGMCPDAALLRRLKECKPKVLGLFLALTGSTLGGTDMTETGLATHFVKDPSLRLLDELRFTPKDNIDIVLDRNCISPPPPHLACPIQSSPHVTAALERALLNDASLIDILDRLYTEQRLARSALQSCAWHTRELAEEVSDVLDEGIDAIHASPPLALQTTFLLLTNPDFDVFFSSNDLDTLITALNHRLASSVHNPEFSRANLIESQQAAAHLLRDTLRATFLHKHLGGFKKFLF
mmetsp:Transcript_8137/g.10371  ORF Transcript_8137/g.10371 Transcript_8137/m.10371 type:complete len:366 (+) Transcript_8137:3-1100(+)